MYAKLMGKSRIKIFDKLSVQNPCCMNNYQCITREMKGLKVDLDIRNVIGIPYTWYSPKCHSVWSTASRFQVASHFETSAQSFKTFLI